LVYADIAQSAGCTPIDVKAMGLDFCACSSFKWLMGNFGLGFLYAREDLLERPIRRYCFSFLLMPGIGPGNSRSMPGPGTRIPGVGDAARKRVRAPRAELWKLHRAGVSKSAHRRLK
jgi:cysteine sulfinate desulfinase/cysteine desulfurase-like protein